MNLQRPSPVSPRARIILAIYLVILLTATHIPEPDQTPELPRGSDKVMHFAAYLVAACLMQRCFSSRWRPRYAAGYAGLILLGGLDELTQALVTRTPSVYDFLADAAGIISCLVVALTAPSIRNYFVNKQLRQSTDTAENVFVDPNELSE